MSDGVMGEYDNFLNTPLSGSEAPAPKAPESKKGIVAKVEKALNYAESHPWPVFGGYLVGFILFCVFVLATPAIGLEYNKKLYPELNDKNLDVVEGNFDPIGRISGDQHDFAQACFSISIILTVVIACYLLFKTIKQGMYARSGGKDIGKIPRILNEARIDANVL
jgi:hypothetical protein